MPPVQSPANPRSNGRQAQVMPMVPFTAAAHEHVEPGPTFTALLGAAVQQAGPFDVPSYGYLRNIYLQVSSTGGIIGTAVAGADFPFNILQQITLLDVNGAPLYGPLDGYAAAWTNIVGGYAFRQDPRLAPSFSGVVTTPTFFIRIPVEISHYDGLGSLANQNAAAAYKLSFALNSVAAGTQGILASGAYATAPTITVRTWIECWSLPNSTDMAGRPQQQTPPAHGTAQYWTSRRQDVLAGVNTVQLTRMGNLLRNVFCIVRDATGARVDTAFPDPILFNWDARQLFNESQFYRINTEWERWVVGARDTGIFVYSWSHSVHNRSGDETPNLWIPTVQSTRMEFNGNFAVPGSVQVLTNDIAPAEVVPAERYVERSDTGFNPNPDAAGIPVT